MQRGKPSITILLTMLMVPPIQLSLRMPHQLDYKLIRKPNSDVPVCHLVNIHIVNIISTANHISTAPQE